MRRHQYQPIDGIEDGFNNNYENNQNRNIGCCGSDDIVLTNNDICKYTGCCGIFTLLLLFIIWGLNFIPYNEYALTRNRLGTVYSTPVLTQGMYYLFPIYGTVIFPSTLIDVNFKSTVFSDTGLEFVMEIWSCYQLPKNNIYKIYNKFSNSYDLRVQSISKKTIKNLAATFSVSEFLQNRTKIERIIAKGVYDDLLVEMSVYAPTEYFKITDIKFPQNILDNSLQSALALQNVQLQENQQYVQVVIADTAKMVATINSQTNQILQNSISESNRIIASGNYESDRILTSARSEGIKKTVNYIGITENVIQEFVDVMALIDNNNKTIFHDIGSQIIVNTAN